MCCGKFAKNLCTECDVCIERSVFSHPKGYQYSNKNIVDPKFVTQGNGKKYLWDCIYCPHTFPAAPNKFLKKKNGCPYCAHQKLCHKDENCKLCFNNSFASLERAKNVVDKSIDLTQVFKNSCKKCDFLCECGHDFPSTYARVTRGDWCPYCANQKLCPKEKNCLSCFNKSFASSERAKNVVDKSIDLTQVFLNNYNECEFWCDNCPHSFPSTYMDVTQGQWCPFCSNPPRKLCYKDNNCDACFNKSFASSERAHNVVDKSIDLTQIFISSSKKCEFQCDKNHYPWISTYNNINKGNWCPHCQNKTQTIILEYVKEHIPFKIIPQKTFEWCRSLETGRLLPFDIVIPELKLILEPDGPHHFEDMECWKSKFKIVAARDVYKMKCAMEHGYTFLRICQKDVWNNTFNWQQLLLSKIRLYVNPVMKRIANDKSIYDYHKELLKEALTEE